MKITLIIPDDSMAAVFTILYGHLTDMNLRTDMASSKDLHDGAVIVIPNKKEGGE